jgi:hypothetical protein
MLASQGYSSVQNMLRAHAVGARQRGWQGSSSTIIACSAKSAAIERDGW